MTAIGAGVSMAFSEGLSDTGDLTGRGRPHARGATTDAGTFLGGALHTLPFLIPRYRPAVLLALAAIAFELLALAWIRRRFLGTSFLSSLITVTSPPAAPRSVPPADRRRRFSPLMKDVAGTPEWTRLDACRAVTARRITRSLRSGWPGAAMLDTGRPSPDKVTA